MTIFEVGEGVEVSVEANKVIVKAGDQQLAREFPIRSLSVSVSGNSVKVENKIDNSKSRALVGTFCTHIKNMIRGLQEPFVYKLRVCSAHFPMSVKHSGNEIQVQNFLGSKKPKKVKVPQGADIKIEGPDITITSADIELAGIVATRLEQSTRLRKKDRRVFQDGIFLVSKAGKPI